MEKTKNVTEIQSILGLIGFYRKFVQRFFSIAVSLLKLTQNNFKFSWSEECEKRFRTLNKKLDLTPDLVLPIEDKNFTIYSDTKEMTCVLTPKEGRVIAYVSRQLKP